MSLTINSILDRLPSIFSKNPRSTMPIFQVENVPIFGLFATVSYIAISRCYLNYQAWLAMGPGGMPYNIFGWAIQSTIGLFLSNDLLSTKVYTDSKTVETYGSFSNKRFIVGELRQREGIPPTVQLFVAPQRQDGEGSSKRIRVLEEQLVNSISTSNPHIVTISTSVLEKRGAALFLNADIPLQPWAKHTRREIAHIHTEAEGSGHVTLSLADAKEVIEKGWGLRHKLSGPLIPVGYLLLYAPRNEEELEVLGRILKAGIAFMSGGKEVV